MNIEKTGQIDPKKICIICNGEILPDSNGWEGGHSPRPLYSYGRCCETCNKMFVEPAQCREAIKHIKLG